MNDKVLPWIPARISFHSEVPVQAVTLASKLHMILDAKKLQMCDRFFKIMQTASAAILVASFLEWFVHAQVYEFGVQVYYVP